MSLKSSRLLIQIVLLLMVGLPQISLAAGRAQTMEFTFSTRYVDETDIDFAGGSSLNVDDELGFGFGLAYNVNSRLALRGSLSWLSSNYTANYLTDNPLQPTDSYRSRMDNSTLAFGADYYFSEGKVSPFISGQFGWTFVDSNIPAGPPSSYCWWDPWWGYICDTDQPTVSESALSYGLAAGLRFDINKNTFLRASIGEYFIDFDNSKGSNGKVITQFELGFSFN